MARSNAKKLSKREADEMSTFWNLRAKGPATPNPQPLLEATSIHVVIHKMADNLPSEAAREIQETNYRVFSKMRKKAASY